MKFGKSLNNQIEEALPDWRDKFLSYKKLKKRLKSIDPGTTSGSSKRPRVGEAFGAPEGDAAGGVSMEEIEFVQLLENELEKFNAFFVGKEEDYIIRLKELQDRVANSAGINEETIKIRKEIVDFHGEMVLLENYSALNYTGLVKILKKYDKKTGALIRLPFIHKVLQQPFFTTDLLYRLVEQCETMLDYLLPNKETGSLSVAVDGEGKNDFTSSSSIENADLSNKELIEIEIVESLYMKSIVSALRVLKEIRSRSSTVGVFSLPPL